MLDDGPLRSNSTQHATEEELWIFWSTNDVYDPTKLNLSTHLVADTAIQKKRSKL